LVREQDGHPINGAGCPESSYDQIQWLIHMQLDACTGLSIQAYPFRLQLDPGLGRPLPALRTEELVHVKGLFAIQHVIDGPSQFVSEYR
jgi:hypothetical protein